MTTARRELVDVDVTRYYHCISRCVRGAYLFNGDLPGPHPRGSHPRGSRLERRKQWIERRLELLASAFAISVAGFVVMDNHLHVLVRLDPEHAKLWSDEEVIKRWLTLCPPKGIDFGDPENVQKWIQHYARNRKKTKQYREWLADLGWFMKLLKEPLARLANKQDNMKGTFWESRYKSIAVLDEEAILATCAYIDLNPLAAQMAATPESSKYTSIGQRIRHFQQKGKLHLLKSAREGSIRASRTIGNTEQDHWLIPFEDRRPHTNSRPSSEREGMLEKFTLGNYLLLIDYTGRLFRKGKARMSDTVREIFDRLDSSIEFWSDKLKKMLTSKQLWGRCFAGSEKGIPAKMNKLSPRAINLSPQMAD